MPLVQVDEEPINGEKPVCVSFREMVSQGSAFEAAAKMWCPCGACTRAESEGQILSTDIRAREDMHLTCI